MPADDSVSASSEAARADAAEDASAGDALDEALLQIDDEAALEELRGLLVADERRSIERLEGAVTGFLSAVIRDEALDRVVREITGRAVEDRLRALDGELAERVRRQLRETLDREIAVRRGEMPDRVGPLVDDAVAERIRLAERHIAAFVQPAFDDVMQDLCGEARQRLVNELTPEVLQLVRKRVADYRPRLEPLVGQVVEEMVGGALRASAGRHLVALVEDVRLDAERRNRRRVWIVAAAAGVLLLVTAGWAFWQSGRLEALRKRTAALEAGASAEADAAGPNAKARVPAGEAKAPARPKRSERSLLSFPRDR